MSSGTNPDNPVDLTNTDELEVTSSSDNFQPPQQVPQESGFYQNGGQEEETNETAQRYGMDVEGAEYAMEGDQIDQMNQEGVPQFDGYTTDALPIFQRVEDPICHEHNRWEDPNLFWNSSIEPIIFHDEYRPPNTLEDALKETNLNKETAAMMTNLCASIQDDVSPYVWLLIESEDMRNLFTEQLMMPCNLERLPWKGLLYNTLCGLRALQKGFGTFYCVETKFKQLSHRWITWSSFLYVTDNSDIMTLREDEYPKTIYVLENTIAYYVMPSFFIVEPSSSFFVRSFTQYNNTMIVYMTMIQDNGRIHSIFPRVGPPEDDDDVEEDEEVGDKANSGGEGIKEKEGKEKEEEEKKKGEQIPLDLGKASYSYQELMLVCSFIQRNFDYKNKEHYKLIKLLIKNTGTLISSREFSDMVVTTLAITAKNMMVLAKLVDCDLFVYLSYLLNSYSRDLEFKIRILNLMKLLSLAGYNKINPDIDALYGLFTDSIEESITTRYLVEIFKAFTKNYKLAEKLAETNIEGTIYEFLYNKYQNISMCNFLSKPFQNKLKYLDNSQLELIIRISSNVEYLETPTMANMISIIFLIPVTEDNSSLFTGAIGMIVDSIRKNIYKKEFTINALKTFSVILKYPDLTDSFLQNEGLEIVFKQLYEPDCTEKIIQYLVSILKFLSYEANSIECIERNHITEIVLRYLRDFPGNPLICEPGLIMLRNVLKKRSNHTIMIDSDCNLMTIYTVLRSNPKNIKIAKKVFSIIQKVAYTVRGKDAILTQIPEFIRYMAEFLKGNYRESKSLCVDAMCALRNMAAGVYAFKLVHFVNPNEIIPVSIEILRNYRSESQGGVDELVKVLKEYQFEGAVCINVAGALKNLKAFGPANERMKAILGEDKELATLFNQDE